MDVMKLAKALIVIKESLPELYKYAVWFLIESQRLKEENGKVFCQYVILSKEMTLTVTIKSLVGIIFSSQENVETQDQIRLERTEEIFGQTNQINEQHLGTVVASHLSIQ